MRKLDPRDPRVVELDRMLASPGWETAARPALEGELAKARRQLERVSATDVAKVAGLQDRIQWLKRLLKDPREVLTPSAKDAEEIEDEIVGSGQRGG